MSNAINMVAFQAAWFACVVGAARGVPWLGVAVTAVVVAVFVRTESRRGSAALFVLGTAFAGVILEFVLSRSGIYSFVAVQDGPIGQVIDLAWMSCLWAAFATTLPRSLAWLSRRRVAGVVFGAVGGPLAFVAGEQLGAIRLGDPRTMALVVLGVVWAIAVPLLGSVALHVLPAETRRTES
ncbi:MAG: DUF2878 domain-containing protein [Planctomycetes bacterium]|nr:DUF2878 domain-containing protein [Planctomycetota bacterium]